MTSNHSIFSSDLDASTLHCVLDKPSISEDFYFMETKSCSQCKEVKELSEFNKSGETKIGYSSACKICKRKWYYSKNKHKYVDVDVIIGEVWVDLIGYEGLYQVSNIGRVKTVASIYKDKNGDIYRRREKIHKSFSDSKRGYLRTLVYKNGEGRSFSIHRLVAISFIPNTENKRTVNHINGIKTDNRVENLEWATDSEQQLHTYNSLKRIPHLKGKTGKLHHSSKSIIQMSLDGSVIKKWDSIADVERAGIGTSVSIWCCLKNRSKTSAGYKWEYA